MLLHFTIDMAKVLEVRLTHRFLKIFDIESYLRNTII